MTKMIDLVQLWDDEHCFVTTEEDSELKCKFCKKSFDEHKKEPMHCSEEAYLDYCLKNG